MLETIPDIANPYVSFGDDELFGYLEKIMQGAIVDGRGKDDAIKGRIEMIKRQVEETDSDFDREKLQERLAKLSGGVAVVQVGAATETELKEKKHRIEDALSATRAAVQEGMIPGGGSSLVNALKALEGSTSSA